MSKILPPIFHKRKYEILLFAILLHLFIGIGCSDLAFYADVLWPFNMFLLGVSSFAVFYEKNKTKRFLKNILSVLVVLLPIYLVFVTPNNTILDLISLVHIAFFTIIFIEILQFLLKPSYINADVVTASACGYLLLIEIGIFCMFFLYNFIPNSFKGIDETNFTTVYLDIVYFCSVCITSIGFGDITPNNHYAKLGTSMMGIAGQFYSVVLVGIMISKYVSHSEIKK